MASLSCTATFFIRCSTSRGNQEPNKQKLNEIDIVGTSMMPTTKLHMVSSTRVATTYNSVTSTENGHVSEEQIRQNIPTKKQFVDPFRQGLIIEGGVGYRQTIVIRSYEVGPDKTATLESILNLLQETALNHVWMGEVVEIDTWVGASGKNGMRRDWQIRGHATGQQTRRLSKMPEEVRAEISPWFIEKQAIHEDAPEKIVKLDDNAKYMHSDLKPKRSDLDMNQHVNNVKYVRWMLETIPDEFLEKHQLSGITLEYRRECGSSDTVQSLSQPDEDGILNQKDTEISLVNGFSLAPEILEGNGLLGWPPSFTHLLQVKGEPKNEEIVRGRTTWKKKHSKNLDSS
ncbi:Acyl-ACP thioesterase [Dillenia turbinata]|uniref:Acyl-ACP thioesterase n=1 Tax=Dillenia turbinata TaxID=194707 RepID=A0AAN8UVW6_9MAGN